MKKLTVLLLALSLTGYSQTGTWKLAYDIDYPTGNKVYANILYLVNISYIASDSIQYIITSPNSVLKGKSHIINEGGGLYQIQTDFRWNISGKAHMYIVGDTMRSYFIPPIYDANHHIFSKQYGRGIGLKAGKRELEPETGVYPNPATDYINIPYECEIINIAGQVVMTTSGRTDISALPAGIYFAKSIDNQSIIVKFVKK